MDLKTPILVPIVGAPKEGPSVAGYHKIVDYLRCQQEYKFRHVMGIKPKDQETKDALAIGVLTHHGRATWFGSQFKAKIEECTQAVTDYVKQHGSPVHIRAEKEAIRLVSAYIEHWRSKPLPLCRAVEYEVGPAPLKPGDTFFQYRTARFDDVCNYPDALNKLCIGDLKTTSDTIAACVNEYKQHGQFILYSILWKMAKEGQALLGPIDGIMVDIETKEAVPKFHREKINVTAFQEQWYTANMRQWLLEASLLTERSQTPRNVTQCARSVSRKGSFLCDYHPLCQYGGAHASRFVDKEGNTPSKELIEI